MKATMIIMFMLAGQPQISTMEYDSMYDCLKANVNISSSIANGYNKGFDQEKRRCVEGSNFRFHESQNRADTDYR